MKICTNCGRECSDDTKICPKCGWGLNSDPSMASRAKNESPVKLRRGELKFDPIPDEPRRYDYNRTTKRTTQQYAPKDSCHRYGFWMAIFMGIIGLIIGLMMYRDQPEAKASYKRGWGKGYALSIVLAVITAVIVCIILLAVGVL